MVYLPICCAAMIYALTGGPSSGKTSIIKELEKRGEPVIHEAATDWIIGKIAAGIFEPWKEEGFIYSFAMANRLAGTKTLACVNKLLSSIDLNQRYKAIFFIMPYCENFSSFQTAVRRENTQEAAKLEVATYAIYCRHDNFIMVPGGMSPAERVDFILEKINEVK